MTTHRDPNRSRYTVVGRGPIANKDLTFRALGLLVWLLDKPDDWRVDASAIAKERREGRGAILKALTELEQAGHIIRHKHRDELNRWSTTTDIHEVPIPGVRFADSGSPDSGSPDVGPVDSLPQELKPNTETAAAGAHSELSTEVLPLELPAEEETVAVAPVALVERACQLAAEASHRAEAQRSGQVISNLARYAQGRAGDYLARHRATLATMAAAGDGVDALVAAIEAAEADPLLAGPAVRAVEPVRPRLAEFVAVQGEFEEPGAVDFAEARARLRAIREREQAAVVGS